jgi:3-phosphoshikimate 1-carboxyvinyltransferase
MQELLYDFLLAVNEGRSSFDWFATHDGAPIKVLVEALEQLEPYEKEVGYPPIRIKGQR